MATDVITLPVPRDFGPVDSQLEYDIDYLRVGDLTHVEGYQRSLNDRHVNRIVSEFTPSFLGVITISWRPDGSFYVLDGQHRIAALLVMGHADWKVPCVLYQGLDAEGEARIFHALNAKRRTMSAQEVFNAATWAKDPETLAVDAIIRQYGWVPNPNDSRKDRGRFYALGTAMRIHRNYSGSMLSDVLDVCARAYGTEHGPTAQLMMAIAQFLTRYREANVDRDRLVKVLRETTPALIDSHAKDIERADRRVSRREAAAHHLLALYNYKLRKGTLPAWDDMTRRGFVRQLDKRNA